MGSGAELAPELDAQIVIDAPGDFDGIQLGDIDGDGELEILASNGVGGAVFWYDRKGEPADPQPVWSRHLISDGHGEIEGNDLADVDGDGRLEAFTLDQKRGEILIHKPTGDPRGPWRTATLIRERPYLQESLAVDLSGSGRPDLIYTWEGSGPGQGGIHCLSCHGSDPLVADHWRDVALTTHPGAWWLVPRLLDLAKRGEARDLVYTARATSGRNAAVEPGLFWLAAPAGEGLEGGRWRKHVIDASIPHPLHVAAGSLAGDAQGRDLVVGDFTGTGVYLYSCSDGFRRQRLPNPGGEGRIFNVQVACIASQRCLGAHRREDILVAVAHAGVYLYRWRDGAYRAQQLFSVAAHPLDDRVLWHDLDGDGLQEAYIADSGGMRLLMLRFRPARTGPCRPAGRPGR